MTKPAAAKRTFEDLLIDIEGQVIELTWGYAVWWVVADNANRPRFQQVLESYPNYFKATFTLFQAGFFVAAHRLFDHEKNSLSLRLLVQSLQVSNPTRAAMLHKKLQDNEALLLKVLRLRHNVFGHRSPSKSPAAEFADIKIKPKEMKAVLRLAQEITVELALDLGIRRSQLLAEQFKQCEQDVRDETLMVLSSLGTHLAEE